MIVYNRERERERCYVAFSLLPGSREGEGESRAGRWITGMVDVVVVVVVVTVNVGVYFSVYYRIG